MHFVFPLCFLLVRLFAESTSRRALLPVDDVMIQP